MKLQTSLEFIVLLSAVALFSVFVLSQYLHLQSAQKAAYETLDNQTLYDVHSSNAIIGYSDSINLIPVVANVSYINKSGSLEVVVAYPQSYNLERIRVSSIPNISILPPELVDIPYSSIDALTFSYLPKVLGSTKFSIVGTFSNTNGSILNVTANAYTYVLRQSAIGNISAGNNFIATIGDRNESVFFPIAQQNNVESIYSWSHCAYHNASGREREPWQCGSNTWGFVVSDNTCNRFWWDGQDRYYCFAENKTASKAGALTPQQSYVYSAAVSLVNASYALEANFTSQSRSTGLYFKNSTPAGIVYINSTYAGEVLPPPYLTYAVLDNSGNYTAINYTYYGNYSNTETSLINLLNINNNTWVGGDTLNYIQKTLANLLSSEKALLSAKPIQSGDCLFYPLQLPAFYSCRPTMPFSYEITVFIDGYNGLNQSVQYQGSSIELR
ncbi:MAG: hypothetical protein LVQ95_04425 [Candidatus Micrarchaeales archaeon]|nr:hypothetical protein [Candidatus Micrarchaeales archaeon]